MDQNGLLMHEKDNVVVCTKELKPGELLQYRANGKWTTVEVKGLVPVWNKIAIRDIEEGESILKYGEAIGKSTSAISQGEWVSHFNIMSMPRKYEDEIV